MPRDTTAGARVTLTQLAYAVAVDTHRHFARAARACGVTQPTLSMQLRALEDALQTPLFDRSRTPVVPTDAGAVLLAQARVVLLEVERLGELRDAAQGAVAGELRVGVIPTLAPYLLPDVLELLAARFPRLELVVEERVTEALLEGLRTDALDAGLVATAVPPSEFIGRPLFHEPFVGYVAREHRLAGRPHIVPGDLALDDLWLLTEGHCLRTHVVGLCGQRGRRPASGGSPVCTRTARFESGNLETLKRLVERGSGMTLLPALAAASLGSDAERRLLVPFAPPAPTRAIRLVRRRRHRRVALVKAFAAVVREVASAALPPDAERGLLHGSGTSRLSTR